MIEGTPHTSAASLAAFSVLMCWPVGINLAAQVAALLLGGELVLPVHSGGPGGDHRLHQLERVQHAAEACFRVSHDRGQPVRRVGVARLGPGDLISPEQRVIDPAHHLRHRVDRVQALVRVGLPSQVGVGRHLPAGQVDRLQPGLDLLHGLIAGHRAKRIYVVFAAQQRPEPLGTKPGQGELLLHGAAQPDHVGGRIGPLGS